jgi:hypothetical protein
MLPELQCANWQSVCTKEAMHMSDLAQTIHKAITDQGFRAALAADPTSALSCHGLALNEQEMVALADIVRLVECSSEDLLSRLLATADGPEQVWHLKEKSQRYSVLEP